MKAFRIFLFTLALALCAAFSASCTKNGDESAVDLSLFDDLISGGEWAVITEPYAAYREHPTESSNVKAHGRLGDIAHITGKTLVTSEKGAQTLWYRFEDGYISENMVFVYSNRLQAENAAARMKE